MLLYPDVPSRRNATLAIDLLAILSLLGAAWLGLTVHDEVAELANLGRGLRDTGGAVQEGLGSAADAVGQAPLVGGQIADALRGAGRDAGGEIAQLGVEGEASARAAARAIGWATFLVPALLILSRWLPGRWAQVRKLAAARELLAGVEDPERRHLLAERAAFGLPYSVLLRHTRDPLGDLTAGRLDALIDAAREDAGLRRSRQTDRRGEEQRAS